MLRLAMVNPRTTYPAVVGALAFFAGAFSTYTTLRWWPVVVGALVHEIANVVAFANTKDAG